MMWGRYVHVREDVRATYPVVPNNPARSFQDATVVHPAIDCRVVKTRAKTERPEIPADCLRLQQMWRQVLRNDEERSLASGTIEPCALCQHDLLDARLRHQCALCLLTWHPRCAAYFAQLCNQPLASPEYKAEVDALLPGEFKAWPKRQLSSTC